MELVISAETECPAGLAERVLTATRVTSNAAFPQAGITRTGLNQAQAYLLEILSQLRQPLRELDQGCLAHRRLAIAAVPDAGTNVRERCQGKGTVMVIVTGTVCVTVAIAVVVWTTVTLCVTVTICESVTCWVSVTVFAGTSTGRLR
jgi:molybdopterin-binding protein